MSVYSEARGDVRGIGKKEGCTWESLKQVDEHNRVSGSLRKLPDAFNHKNTCFNPSKKSGVFFFP